MQYKLKEVLIKGKPSMSQAVNKEHLNELLVAYYTDVVGQCYNLLDDIHSEIGCFEPDERWILDSCSDFMKALRYECGIGSKNS